MSWQLVSFLILAAVLLGGFAWYERSRPPAQVVALVAALAALAIAGRIAFAAFPNVKPTTDIVIFAGYALGPAPGFAVGALAALVSNFWFGQGPWTPWQMAGWGLCGVLGAALALGGRRVGRLTLALACGFAGIAYGALLNFSLMATYGGELSLERFGVLMARAIPFDAAHAIGNVALALVAGPAIVRMLSRFRQRFEWERGGGGARPPTSAGAGPSESGGQDSTPPNRRLKPALKGGGIATFAVLALLLGALAPGSAKAAGPASASKWLFSVQNSDGGFGASPGDDSGVEMTAWAMLGLEAAGRNPLDLNRGGRTPVSFLRANAGELKSPGDLARTILALHGAGVDPRALGGRNLVADLRGWRRDNGAYLGWPNSTAFAVIALRAAGAPGGTEKSLEWLRRVQAEDGGWGIEAGQRSDPESTGSVLQALSPGSEASKRGLRYLRSSQQGNGGYRLGGNGEINTQATAWAIQGILAAGANPNSFEKGGATPLDYIAANQAADGHYRYSKSRDQTPIWVTGQALVATSRKHFPIAAPERETKPPQSSSSNSGTGGAAPAPSAPSITPSPGSEPVPLPPSSGAASGGGGPAPESFAGPGPSTPEGPAAGSPPAQGEGGGSAVPAPELLIPKAPATDAAEPAAIEEDDEGASVAGSILAGLLAGCLLVGAVLLGRKGWMRWRYGL